MSNEPGGSAGAHGDPQSSEVERCTSDDEGRREANQQQQQQTGQIIVIGEYHIVVSTAALQLWWLLACGHQYRSQQEFDKGKACCII